MSTSLTTVVETKRDSKSLRDYWMGKVVLDADPASVTLDRPLSPEPVVRDGILELEIPGPIGRGIEKLSGGSSFLVYATFLAAAKACLFRYTGKSSIVTGSPMRTRSSASASALNALAIADVVDGQMAFRELLIRVRENLLQAYQRQAYPFDQLVRDLRLPRHGPSCPLFRMALRLEDIHAEMPDVRHDVEISLKRSSSGYYGVLTFSSYVYKEDMLQRFWSHVVNLLSAALENPDIRIANIPFLGNEERKQLLVDWSGRERAYPQCCVHELFEEQVRKTPESVAVVYAGQQLSYRELNQRANRLGRYLRELGVGPEVRVGICVERSLEMIVGLLAILKAGGAYVPLDPEYPVERLAYMVEDAQVGIVLTQERLKEGRLKEAVPSEGLQVISLDGVSEEVSRWPDENLSPVTAPNHLAYIMYTSGSTGQPKGVAVEHRSVVRLVKETDYVALGEKDVFLQLAPVSFDASTFEIWGSLGNGGRLEVFAAGRPTLEELTRTVEEREITVLWLTAGLFHQVVESDVARLRGVRQLLAGGEALSAAHVRRASEALAGTRIINGYGPTEGTTFSCCYGMNREQVEALGENVPIGRPIMNTRVYVLDEGMESAPVGIGGELYIGGVGVARGYWQQAAMTAEKFVPDGFTGQAGQRLYRTGDRVRWTAEGKLEFLGRSDQQVKLRGYRIELGEIEVVLQQQESVEQAAVVVREDEPGDKRLVGYVVWRTGVAGEIEELKRKLRSRLPEYMVPGMFVELEELPLTVNGKVDRRKLPAPEWEKQEREYVGSRTVTEELVAGIFEAVLKRERVGVEENFFEIGGHSLLATQVISRIRTVFQVDLPLRVLFESPTIAELAVKISEIHEMQMSIPAQGAAILPLARERFRVSSSSKATVQGVK